MFKYILNGTASHEALKNKDLPYGHLLKKSYLRNGEC